jgi:NAD(P)-dependent dehydrogenase (short-subunit alcohol dehydrogenase family)
MSSISNLFNLTGKTALVTGASGGLGEHFARTLAAAGVRTVLTARRTNLLEQIKHDVEAKGGTAFTAELDVTDRAQVEAIFNDKTNTIGPIDILINNAGIAVGQAAEQISETDWDRLMDTNLKGAWLMSQAFARSAIARNAGGVIINVASILGRRVAKGVAPYAASKAALEHLTRALALEWARYGIRVNAIAPGYFDTDMNRDFLNTDAGQAMLKRIPQRRAGSPEELDGALLLLAGDASSYMTGTTLVVDGGHLCSTL